MRKYPTGGLNSQPVNIIVYGILVISKENLLFTVLVSFAYRFIDSNIVEYIDFVTRKGSVVDAGGCFTMLQSSTGECVVDVSIFKEKSDHT